MSCPPPANNLQAGGKAARSPRWSVALPLARIRPALRRLSRRRMGPPRKKQPGSLREANSGWFSGRLVLDHDLAKARGFQKGVRRLRPIAKSPVSTPGGVHEFDAERRLVRNRAKIEAPCCRPAPGWKSNPRRASPIISGTLSTACLSSTTPRALATVPTQSATSARLSKDLKARGFKFCGPTSFICLYAGGRDGRRPSGGLPRAADEGLQNDWRAGK